MWGKQVEISYEGNYYDLMVGNVIYEGDDYVTVEITIVDQFPQQVTFYKD
jgi:hypothetical protein